MHKTSTTVKVTETSMQSEIRPKKATVEFIKQFARVYTFCAMMPAGLGEFIAN